MKNLKQSVLVNGEVGGRLTGVCSICGSSGLLETPYGFPDDSHMDISYLVHKAGCKMNDFVDKDGNFHELHLLLS